MTNVLKIVRPMWAVLPIGALLLLAACGGSSTAPTGASFKDMRSRGIDLIDRLPGTATPTANLPTSGSATYRGVAGFSGDPTFDPRTESSILSDMSLTARCDAPKAEQISGTLSNFRGTTARGADRLFPGTLNISSSSLPGGGISGNGFSAGVTGTLANPSGVDAKFNMRMDGHFRGTNSGFVAGTMSGSLTSTVDGTEPFYGQFAGER